MVDVIDDKCPLQAWVCTIMENCGGRLKLRYLGYIHDDQDFWLFYYSWRVHPLGWAKERKVAIGPPKGASKLDKKVCHVHFLMF